MRVQKKPWTSPAIFCRAEREPGHVNTTVMILLIVMSHFKEEKRDKFWACTKNCLA